MMMLVQACANIVIGCINLCHAVGAVLTNAADSSMIQEEGGVQLARGRGRGGDRGGETAKEARARERRRPRGGAAR